MRHRTVQLLLYDYLKGELSAQETIEVREHLAQCNTCFGEQQIIRESMRLLQPKQVKPSEALTETYWHNFAVQVQHRIQADTTKTGHWKFWWESNRSWFLFHKVHALSITGGLAVVMLALILLPLARHGETDIDNRMVLTSDAPVENVDQELSDYFHKSKVLLVGISNLQPENHDPIDLSVERDQARTLVKQARYFDHREIDGRSRMLIQAMEKILIELANLEEQAGLSDVELIRTGIREENMLFKIRIAETATEAGQKNSVLKNN